MACILRKSVRALRVLRVGRKGRRKNRPEMAIKKNILEKEVENSQKIINILQVIVTKPIHLNVIICRRLHLEQVGRALRILRVLRHIHHCKSFLLPQRALQRLCNQKEDEISRRERWITMLRMVPSWMRSQRSPATNVGL